MIEAFVATEVIGMKKLFALFLFLPVLVACGGAQTSQKTTKIVVATAGDVPPFVYEKDGQLTGYDAEVLKAVAKELPDYEVSFQKTSWESIFPGIDAGRYQAAANNLSYTEERAAKYLYSLPIAKNPLVLVSQEKSPLDSLDQIAGKITQDDTGTSTAKLVDDWNQQHTNNPAKIDYSGEDVGKRLMDLENGEFDFLVFDKISVAKIIKDRGLKLHVVELPSTGNPNNYIVFSKEDKDFQEKFNQTLKKLYENGQLEKLSQELLGGSYLPDKSELN